MFKVLGNFFQKAYPCIFVVIVSGLCPIVYTKIDESYIEWQRITASDNEWQQVVQRMTTSENEWQQVTHRMKTTQYTSKNGYCHPYYDKNRYTTSVYGWLQVEWLNKETALKVFQERSCYQNFSVPYNPWKNGWLQQPR